MNVKVGWGQKRDQITSFSVHQERDTDDRGQGFGLLLKEGTGEQAPENSANFLPAPMPREAGGGHKLLVARTVRQNSAVIGDATMQMSAEHIKGSDS